MGFLFRFSGRIGRLHWNLAQIAIGVLLLLPFPALVEFRHGTVELKEPGIAVLGILLLTTWIGIAVSVQRLHDRDRSGFWLVPMLLVPFIGSLWMIVELGFMPGTPGPNRFGPPPGRDGAPARDRDGAERHAGGESGPRFDMDGIDRAIAELKARRAESMHRAETARGDAEAASATGRRPQPATPLPAAIRPVFGQRV